MILSCGSKVDKEVRYFRTWSPRLEFWHLFRSAVESHDWVHTVIIPLEILVEDGVSLDDMLRCRRPNRRAMGIEQF